MVGFLLGEFRGHVGFLLPRKATAMLDRDSPDLGLVGGAARSTCGSVMEVVSYVLTRLSLFEPSQFRGRLPTLGGSDLHALTD